MSFEAPESSSPNLVNSSDIQDKTFSSAWKGYRQEEVRAYLAQLAQVVKDLESELESTKAQLAELSDGGRESADASSTVLRAEETAAQIIRDANEAARALRDQARSYADTTRKMAEDEAQRILDDAQSQSVSMLGQDSEDRLAAQVEETTKRELDQARSKASEIVGQAKLEGRAMIEQARDLRNEILADLRHKRSILESEIADLATRRIEAYQGLARAVQLISEAGAIIVSGDESDSSDDDVESQDDLGEVEDGQSQPGAEEASDEGTASPFERAKPSVSSVTGYQARIVDPQVEMGGHLEEGIVRVFYKENGTDIRTENDGARQSAAGVTVGMEVESQASDSEAQLMDSVSDESGLSGEGALEDAASEPADHAAEMDEPARAVSVADDGSHDEEPDGEVSVVPEGAVADVSTGVASGQPDLRVGAEETLPDPDDDMALAEAIEDAHEGDSGKVDTHVQRGDSQRSRRADEILARIRSLRLGDDELGQSDGDSREAVEMSAENTGQDASSLPDGHFETEEPSDEDLSEIDPAAQELLEVREEVLAPIASMLYKKVKRLLADEQNDLLDKVRRSSGSQVALENLIEEKEEIDGLAIASLDFFEQVRLAVADLFSQNSGSTVRREISKHAVDYSEEFAKEVVLPLRRRIEETLANDDKAEDQSTAAALGAIYRDVRSNRLEPLISQYVNTVFCATVMLESGYESFVWVVDPDDTPCADCLDNSLAGATIRGEPFPTGHHHPGIHSGCRCILVPFIA